MTALPAVNAALVDRLADLAAGNSDALTMLTGYLEAALAVPAGALADASAVAVRGFYIASDETFFTANFVAGHRFVRMEFVAGRSLTVTIPLRRITRVVDEWIGDTLTVTVELDGQGLNGALQAPPGQVGAAQAVTLALPTYVLTAQSSDDAGRAAPALTAFSAMLRRALDD